MFLGHWIHGGSASKEKNVNVLEEGRNLSGDWTLQMLYLKPENLHTVRFKSCRCSPHHILYALTSACCLLSLRKYMCDVIWPVISLITHSLLVINESKREWTTVIVPTRPNPTDVTIILYVIVTVPYLSPSISSTSGNNDKEQSLIQIEVKWRAKHALHHCQNSWTHGKRSFILDTLHFSVLIISKTTSKLLINKSNNLFL